MKNSILLILFLSNLSMAGTFSRSIEEIQILGDRVRLKIEPGPTYGTCGTKEGWWGWSTSNERHNDWLSLALSAQAQKLPITVYDSQNSCSGPVDIIELEGLYLKSNS